MIQLTDDGTLDTVFRCTECGGEERYTYAASDGEETYEEFRASAFKDAKESHECEIEEEDGEEDEPGEDDYTSTDHLSWYQHGKKVLSVEDPEESSSALRKHADKEQFWPNAWFISDHGNAHLFPY